MKEYNLNEFYHSLEELFAHKKGEEIFDFLNNEFNRALESGDSIFMISVGNEFGSYLRVTGDIKKADDVYQLVERRVVDTFGTNSKEYISLLLNLGDVDIVAHRYEEALKKFNQAEELLQYYPKEDYLYATLYNNRSSAYRNVYQLTKSKNDIEKALKLVEENPPKKAISFINLAEINILLGEFDSAKKAITSALSIFETLSDPIHHANALATAGNIYYFKGNYEVSEKYYKEALEKFTGKLGNNPITKLIEENLRKVQKLK